MFLFNYFFKYHFCFYILVKTTVKWFNVIPECFVRMLFDAAWTMDNKKKYYLFNYYI